MTDVFTTGWGWNVPAPIVPRPTTTMKTILAEVAADHGLRPSDITGDRRFIHHVRARQDFMWRARQVKFMDGKPRYSLPQIGQFLGVDHTTVIHGVRAHEKRMGAN